MRAVVCERYGPPELLAIRNVPRPQPGRRELLVRVAATTVTSGDWRIRSLSLPPGFGLVARPIFGFRGPRQPILGTEASGVVEAVGDGATRYRAGDAVFAFPGIRMGCHAEFVVVAEDGPVAPKPANLSHAEAAALSFGGSTALHYLRAAGCAAGKRVLVNGASGGVGTAAVQLARFLGAEVTGVCSAANLDLVREQGAHRVLDYAREDFADADARYDIILDAAGTAPYRRARRCLAPGGALVLIVAGLGDLLRAPLQSLTTGHRVIAGPAAEKPEYLHELERLAAEGHFRPFIERTYSLEHIAAAHHHVATGRKRGNVVVTLAT